MSKVPDSVSAEGLLNHIRQLRKEGGLPPRSTTLPALPVSDPGSGILDLTVVIEQIVLDAGGVVMPQLLHLTSFLLDAVINGIQQEVEPHTKVESPLDLAVVMRANTDVRLLMACQELLHDVLKPMTQAFTANQLPRLKDLGHDGKQALRRLLVSDALLEALGIPGIDFDKHFYNRFKAEFG
jgi:hypothetical protein